MKRHFTRAQVEQKVLNAFSPVSELENVRVCGVNLCNSEDVAQPLWIARCERHLPPFPLLQFQCLVTERTYFNGEPYLTFVLDKSLPSGLSSPAEEDAEIERARRQARELRIAAESAEPEVFLPGEEALHEEVQA